ncbi:MAG: R3H domain-containing nucleic acid-binding protein [bacterium]
MEKLVNKDKTYELALKKLLLESKVEVDELVIKQNMQDDEVELIAYFKKELDEVIKSYLTEVAGGLNTKIDFEIKENFSRKTLNIKTDNGSCLIGKNGNVIDALEKLVRQKIFNNYNVYYNISIDVEDYRNKKLKNIISLAKKTAYEVQKTNISVILDSMTSFERKIVHDELSQIDGIKTISKGEEPNRAIVIECK